MNSRNVILQFYAKVIVAILWGCLDKIKHAISFFVFCLFLQYNLTLLQTSHPKWFMKSSIYSQCSGSLDAWWLAIWSLHVLPGPLHTVSLRVRLLLHDDGHRSGQVPGHLHAALHPGRVQGRLLEAGSHLEPLASPLSALGRLPHSQTNIHMHHSPPMPGISSF